MKSILALIMGLLLFAVVVACALGSNTAQIRIPTIVPVTQSAPTPAQLPTQLSDSTGFVLTVSENDLNRQIAAGIGGAEISNARIDLHPNNLADFSATVRSGSLSLNPTISVQLSARDGRIVIDVLQVQVGGFGMPSSLIEPQIAQIKQSTEAELNRQFAQMNASTGQLLKSLRTSEDQIELTFGP